MGPVLPFDPDRRPAPPSCDCGAALAAPGWQGRATVTCSGCAAVWDLEVGDDLIWRWAVSPSARPRPPEHPFGDHPPERVLTDGVPPPPSSMAPGTWVALAQWQNERYGAVLYAYRIRPEEVAVPGQNYEQEIVTLERDAEGAWRLTGGQGGPWIDPFSPRPDRPPGDRSLRTPVTRITAGLEVVGGIRDGGFFLEPC